MKKLILSLFLLILTFYTAFAQTEGNEKTDPVIENSSYEEALPGAETIITKEDLETAMIQIKAAWLEILNERLAEKAELEKQHSIAVKRVPVIWTLAGLDVLSGVSAVVTGILGKKITDQYYETFG
ncbi:MAG: hypothetical protein KA785_03425 [Spirochaetaceae bacterium]|nr:hypothetical protein [Spirochaetaceae bacterium]